jgi:hypothetical protein
MLAPVNLLPLPLPLLLLLLDVSLHATFASLFFSSSSW